MLRPLALFTLLALGCSSSSTPSPSVDMASAPPGPDLTFVGCSGTVVPTGSASFFGKFKTCQVAVSITPDEMSMVLQPQGYDGSPPTAIELQVVVPKRFKLGTYSLATVAVGTVLRIVPVLGAVPYVAGKPDDRSVPSGTVHLEVWSLPTVPDNPGESWLDKTMHGVLNASLPVDVNFGGAPGTLELTSTF